MAGIIIGAIFAAFGFLIIGGSTGSPESQNATPVGASFVLLGILFIALGVRSRKKKKRKLAEAAAKEAAWQQEVLAIQSATELPIVAAPVGLILQPGEICHFQAPASVLVIKNQVTGYTGGSSGVSVHVAKGLTLHSGGSNSRAIRQDVSYTYPGVFSLTNQRIIMTGEKAVEKPLNKLSNIQPYGREGITLQFGSQSVTIIMGHPLWVPKILDLMRGV